LESLPLSVSDAFRWSDWKVRIVASTRDGDIREARIDKLVVGLFGVHVHQYAVGGGSLATVADAGAAKCGVHHRGKYSTRLIHVEAEAHLEFFKAWSF